MGTETDRNSTHTDYLFVSRGLPRDLVVSLQNATNTEVFVETGTYKGGTTRWAAECFKSVITIEASEQLHEEAAKSGKHQENVSYLCGDSSDLMSGVVNQLAGPALFWLDGHYSGGETAGVECECPVVAELTAIARSDHEHIVFIDDARLFLSTPPKAHRKQDWPTIAETIACLEKLAGNPHIVIIADMIISVPQSCQGLLESWCTDLNDSAWTNWEERQNGSRRKGLLSKFRGR